MKPREALPKITLALLLLVTLLVVYTNLATLAGIPYVPFMTPLISLLAFTFAVLHAGQAMGWPKGLLLLAVTFSVSLLFESVGVATGWVYGGYHYTEKLGWKFLDLVPLIIPIAWFMMSYPSLVIALRIFPTGSSTWGWRLSVAAVGALAMTAWDVAMDPVMVAGGHWVWDQPGGFFGIPLQNYWGWWLTMFVAFLLFLWLGKVKPGELAYSGPGFPRLAVYSYAVIGLSSVIIALQYGMDGQALAGFFAIIPWVIVASNQLYGLKS
jgi:uncharacterized membrane protein